MVHEILNFLKIQNELENLIKNSHYKKRNIIELCGFNVQTFNKKLKNKSFTPNELLRLAKYLTPEEFYKYNLDAELISAENDINNNNVISKDIFLSDLRKHLL
jgi:hypothetical protein